jgi:tRNA pseudouridine55 synthase
MFGFININKPSGMTSHKVIAVLRRITGIKQIGHAGTLDPLASGVLPVAIGKASKLIDYLPSDKSYIAGMFLGKESDTYDIEGNITENNCKKVSLEQIKEVLNNFRGEITQIPPAYSAVHYNGKRLYELARSGKIPSDIPSRKITVYKNEIVDFDYETQSLSLDISCSKGTYIRSIVNDIGAALGCGAVMYKLTRTLSSGMDIKNAVILNEETSKEDLLKYIIPPQDILPLEKAEITEEEYKYVLNGNKFNNGFGLKGIILLLKDNSVIALAEASEDYIQPKKVLI